MRPNIYGAVHKALRAHMTDTLLRVGRIDVLEPAECADAMARVRGLLDFCLQHIAHENGFIHTAIEARRPGACSAIVQGHLGHERLINDLHAAVRAFEAVPLDNMPCRMASSSRVYLLLSLFVADNFEHMHEEETAMNDLLWATHTDAEIIALHDRLVASIPPQETMALMHWMLPQVGHAERVMILADMRAKAPAPAFAAVLDIAGRVLSAADATKLRDALAANVETMSAAA